MIIRFLSCQTISYYKFHLRTKSKNTYLKKVYLEWFNSLITTENRGIQSCIGFILISKHGLIWWTNSLFMRRMNEKDQKMPKKWRLKAPISIINFELWSVHSWCSSSIGLSFLDTHSCFLLFQQSNNDTCHYHEFILYFMASC
jgi:hypothetical protein